MVHEISTARKKNNELFLEYYNSIRKFSIGILKEVQMKWVDVKKFYL